MAELSLVADIGGTNTRVALARGAAVDPQSVRRFANASASGLGEVLQRYLSDTGTDHSLIGGACAAGAGPVRDGAVMLTNLDWRVDPDLLREALSTDRVAVLNDLQAQGHAIGHAAANAIKTLIPQPQAPANAAKLVVGVGTGFNAAPVIETASGRLVMPSECGHISLPDAGGRSRDVAAWLDREFGFASVEEAMSGRGIGQIHAALHGRHLGAPDIMAAVETGDAAAQETVAMAVRLLGAIVGDLALTFLPFGGIYLVGGVSRNLAPWFDRFGFADALRAKGRFGTYMTQFGVSLVTDDYAALAGCAAHLAEID